MATHHRAAASVVAVGEAIRVAFAPPVVTVFLQGLGRWAAVVIELLGDVFAGTVMRHRFPAYNHRPWSRVSLPCCLIPEQLRPQPSFCDLLP